MHRNRGNILFLILLAVVLFAALSYAVTSSMRGGGANANAEKDKADAAMILQRVSLIENAFTRLMMINDYKDYQIDLKTFPPYTTNSNCTATACRLFDPENGYIDTTNIQLPLSFKNPASSGTSMRFMIMATAVANVGTSAPDIILLVERLRPGICKAINDMVGITGTPIFSEGSPAAAFYFESNTMPTGSFTNTTSAIGEEATANQLAGQRTGCGCYHADCSNGFDARFYHVIHAR